MAEVTETGDAAVEESAARNVEQIDAQSAVQNVEQNVEQIEAQIDALMTEAGVTAQRKLIQRILTAGLGLGQDGTSRLNLKITASAVEEMRAAFQLFAPYSGVPKVTIFGSARTQDQDPLWLGAEAVSRELADQGWMVVTGAGPGIMEAAATGAGPERSLGVSIRLPFEQVPEHVQMNLDRLVTMKYFFTRKLMLVKESSGFVCLPGGFGTMDETFELLTLQQTGKMVPVPIVLLDSPGGTFWQGFETFVIDHLERTGVISHGDLDRVLITDSVEEAIGEIVGFWHNYDSLRWVDDRLVLRLRFAPTDAEIEELNESFGGLLERGVIERSDPLPPEQADDDALDLPRLVLTPHHRAAGDFHRLIRALNGLPSAHRA